MTGRIKHIVVIESLENEQLTGRDLYNDCIRRRIDFQGLNFTHQFYSVKTKQELIDLLTMYGSNANLYEEGILLHLEMHGDAKQKGLILSGGNFIGWTELADLFRTINIGTRNNLYISMAICNGRYLYTGVDANKKSPYAAFISASQTVWSKEIAADFLILFESLLVTGNLITSYLEMEKAGTNFYYKDSRTTFEAAFESVLKQLNTNKNLKQEILEEARRVEFASTGRLPTEEEGDAIFNKALKDMFDKQYAAYKF
jgi:hypothetical protein